MGKGDTFRDKPLSYHDPYSGREIVRLTDYFGHSNHLYFTDPCWLKDGRSFVFTSDREGSSNLYSFNLDTYDITQLTALERKDAERPAGCFSAANNCHYFWWGRQLLELNLETLAERVVYETPAGMSAYHARPGVTADGTYVCTRLMKDKGFDGIDFAYARFYELFEAKPFSQLMRIDIQTGKADVIHEDHRFITHENPSPTLPHIMTFCHEGPWHRVEQRIWGLNIQTGETWNIRSQEGQSIAVGHEYWFADGEHIGYHGMPTDGQGHHVYGYVKWDNCDGQETCFPYLSTHFFSLDEKLIVGDGTAAAVFSHQGDAQPYIQLFERNGTGNESGYDEARVLAYHRSTFNDQHAHPHPRFTLDGRFVLYSSDLSRYANIYLVEVGDVSDLPRLSEVEPPRHT